MRQKEYHLMDSTKAKRKIKRFANLPSSLVQRLNINSIMVHITHSSTQIIIMKVTTPNNDHIFFSNPPWFLSRFEQ